MVLSQKTMLFGSCQCPVVVAAAVNEWAKWLEDTLIQSLEQVRRDFRWEKTEKKVFSKVHVLIQIKVSGEWHHVDFALFILTVVKIQLTRFTCVPFFYYGDTGKPLSILLRFGCCRGWRSFIYNILGLLCHVRFLQGQGTNRSLVYSSHVLSCQGRVIHHL